MKRQAVRTLWAVALLAGRGAAQESEEDRNTQPPPMTTGHRLELEASGLGLFGNDRRGRELWRAPENAWLSGRWHGSVAGARGWAETSVEVSTLGNADGRLRAQLASGGRLALRLRRDRVPFSARLRPGFSIIGDADALGRLEVIHDQAEIRFRRPLSRIGAAFELGASYDRRDGDKPMVGTGLAETTAARDAFGMPAHRPIADQSVTVGVGVEVLRRGALLRLDAAFREDLTRERIVQTDLVGGAPAGRLSQLRNENRASFEVGLSAESARPAVVMVGGAYRFLLSHGDPSERNDYQLAPGDLRRRFTEDVGLTSIRNRAVAGVAWFPVRSFSLAARAEVLSTVLSDGERERRELETFQLARGGASYRPWSIDARLRLAYAPWWVLRFEVEGFLRYLSGTDRSSQVFFLANDVEAARRERQLGRDRLLGRAELRAVSPIHRTLRVLAGARYDRDRWYTDPQLVVDSFMIGDRDRARITAFVGVRLRTRRAFVIDGRGAFFDEDYDVLGASSGHRGWDARLHASGALGSLGLFATVAFTDDRYKLSPAPDPSRLVGFVPVHFTGQSWTALAGLHWALAHGHVFTANYNLVVNAEDAKIRLQDGMMRMLFALPRSLQLGLGVRFLWYRDPLVPSTDVDAVQAVAMFGGRF